MSIKKKKKKEEIVLAFELLFFGLTCIGTLTKAIEEFLMKKKYERK